MLIGTVVEAFQYARQFFKFMQWFLAVLASIIAPFVPGFLRFLTLPGIIPKLAIIVVILLLLLFTGVFLGLGEIFKRIENDWAMAFEKRYATPDYEAILIGEEFEYHPKPPPTRRERLTKWWERQKKHLRHYIQKLKEDS